MKPGSRGSKENACRNESAIGGSQTHLAFLVLLLSAFLLQEQIVILGGLKAFISVAFTIACQRAKQHSPFWALLSFPIFSQLDLLALPSASVSLLYLHPQFASLRVTIRNHKAQKTDNPALFWRIPFNAGMLLSWHCLDLVLEELLCSPGGLIVARLTPLHG